MLADGLGGHGGGEMASSTAAESICRNWDGTADAETLTALVREANRRVLAIQTPQCAMKTTVTVLTLAGKTAVWAHAGDGGGSGCRLRAGGLAGADAPAAELPCPV